MNFKTTLALLVLAAAGGACYWFGPRLGLDTAVAPAADAGSLAVLTNELAAERVTGIRLTVAGQDVVLERTAGGGWALPGGWPARQREVGELVGVLTGLRSRFAPIPLDAAGGPTAFGLDQPAAVAVVRAGDAQHHLVFGEKSGEGNRFTRPTYLRVDDKPEVVRLAPGIVTSLERPADYYQQRRLFPSERVAQEGEGAEKVERLAATGLSVQAPNSQYTLVRKNDDWELSAPVRDRADPDQLRTLLTAVPDIWAEQFVAKPKDLAEYGLKQPEETLRVTLPSGTTIVLQVGKQSQMKTRKVFRPAPNLGGPPMPPQQEVIHEEYRYAKLEGNGQVFEIKAEKLKGLAVPPATLRDPRLARFRTEDARRVEIRQGGQEIVLAKDKDRWRLVKPTEGDAEATRVTELLDKLSGLQARDKDVLDGAEAKAYGLDKPALSVTVAVEEEGKGAADTKTKKSRTISYHLGKQDADKAKLYVQVAGWPRINAVEDSLAKLVERPALAYRGRRVLDFSAADLARIEVKRGSESYGLEQAKGEWHLAAPVKADVDRGKVGQLADELGRLEVVEYVTASATPEALEKEYGLARPVVSAKVSFADSKKPSQTLLLGKQRAGKPEFYAKLDGAPDVFTVRKELHDSLDQESLAYRPLQLWQIAPEKVQEFRVQRVGGEYRLRREATAWKISGPFEAPAAAEPSRSLTDELAGLRCEKYAAHRANDLTAYGLDKPYLRLTVVETAETPADPKQPKAPAREHAVLVGKPTEKDARLRYAKLADSDGVFVLGEKTLTAVDRSALDLLDRNLLAMEPNRIGRVRSAGASGSLTLEKQGAEWRVTESPAPAFAADNDAVASLLGVWSNLRAEGYAAYGPKLDLAAYGLDKPTSTVTVTLQAPPDESKAAKVVKAAEHHLELGQAGPHGERYARLDHGPGVIVLSPAVAGELMHGYLDYVNRSVWKLDAAKMTAVERRQGNETLELVRREGSWQMAKPTQARADTPTLDSLTAELANLRASRVAAYPAKDLKPFGLDQPAAVVTVRLQGPDGKPTAQALKLGGTPADAAAGGDRFAQLDGGNTVYVLAGNLARQLVAGPLAFRDRNLARVSDVDRVVMERGSRKATFARVDGSWKMTEPVTAPAEQADLDDFLGLLGRFRVDELVAEKPKDLKDYGLDQPACRWHLYAGNKEALTLLVGKPEQKPGGKPTDAGRRFGKLGGSDLVFLLSAEETKRALGEYRSRTLWPPLDAVQVDRVSFGYREGPFVLQKVGEAWHVEGRPDAKVVPEAMRETLDALAGLRAAHYVADKPAELKLYGLEPPQLVLEVKTPGGPRVLHVGRPEGENKRVYARVVGGEADAVFVISEEDTRRIVRKIPDFARDPPKVATPAVGAPSAEKSGL